MNRLFDIEGPVIQFLNRVADLMILNFLVILCCIPIITAGAAFTAMHYVLLKIVRKEEGYLLKGFFKSFKENFKQATLIWLGILVVAGLYAVDFYIFRNMDVEFSRYFIILFLALAFVFILTALYAFPLLSRFNNSIKNILKNAVSIAILYFPKSLIMVVIYVMPFALVYLSSYSWVFVFMFGISLPAYASAMIYSDIFRKFEPKGPEIVSDYDFSVNTDEGDEEDIDE
ncbi:MAG: YesL family protein [Lachnospiraceae bacterium]|nr:YesL family protein [Lachnospiraceae bacterium]